MAKIYRLQNYAKNKTFVMDSLVNLYCYFCDYSNRNGSCQILGRKTSVENYNTIMEYLTDNNMCDILDIPNKLMYKDKYNVTHVVTNSYVSCNYHIESECNYFLYINCEKCLYYFHKLHVNYDLVVKSNIGTVPEHICNRSDMQQLLEHAYKNYDEKIPDQLFCNTTKSARNLI